MLDIRLLGYPRFQLDGVEIDNRQFRNQRGVALLAFLATTQLAHSRDTLATILWPETFDAKHSLREVLSKIRAVIPNEYLEDDAQRLGLARDAAIRVDVVAFRQLLAQYPALEAQAPNDPDPRIQLLKAAIDLYEDDFLSGFTLRGQNEFYYWQLEQSDQLREEYRYALKELVRGYMDRRAFAAAIPQAQRLVQIEPTSEMATLLLMQAYALEGQRASALQQYEFYLRALDEEGLPLADEVTALFQDIQTGVFPPSSAKPTRSLPEMPAAPKSSPALKQGRGDLRAKVYESVGVILERPRRLIGRDDLLEAVIAACNAQQHVLLAGLGGIGKTTLAAAAAAEFINKKQGKVIWLEIVDAAPEQVFEAIARALDWSEIISSPYLDERVVAMRQRLLDMNALLVLDNAWSGRSLFEVMKAVPQNMPVIVTSRRPIPLEGEIMGLGDLDRRSALELLSYHAGADYHDDPDALALCDRLGNHPFNIEIAGKWLRVADHLSPASLLDEIADAPHDLVIPGEFGELGRESVKDLLDASANVLAAGERGVFAAMGALAAPYASLALFSKLLNRPEDETHKTLRALQQQGLAEIIRPDQDRPQHYRIHDLTYSYARTLYGEEAYEYDTVAAVERFVIERADHEDYDALDFDQINILGAARTASQHGDRERLIQIMKTLVVDGYVDVRGHSSVLLNLLEEAIQETQQLGEAYKETRHYLLSKLGNIYALALGDYQAGVQAYQQALAVARDLKDAHREALLLSVIGTLRAQQDASDARDYLEEARALALRQHDDRALSQVLEHIGHYQLAMKQDQAARETFAASLEVAERLQDETRIFFALINLGASEKDFGNFAAALGLNQRAYEVAQHSDNKIWMAYALESLGEAQDGLQAREAAQRCFDEALALYYQSGATAKVHTLIDVMQHGAYVVRPEFQ